MCVVCVCVVHMCVVHMCVVHMCVLCVWCICVWCVCGAYVCGAYVCGAYVCGAYVCAVCGVCVCVVCVCAVCIWSLYMQAFVRPTRWPQVLGLPRRGGRGRQPRANPRIPTACQMMPNKLLSETQFPPIKPGGNHTCVSKLL